MRENPFAPHVPCHRVIASNLFIGGFQGEWASARTNDTRHREAAPSGPETKLAKKLRLLSEEGVEFDSNGVLLNKGRTLLKE